MAMLRQYKTRVPPHSPPIVTFGVIGYCVWTRACQQQMTQFFQARPGDLFQCPGGECVGVCPSTGTEIPCDGQTKHLLVATMQQGTVIRGSTIEMLTRVMPRVLTLEGYEAMMGPAGDHRRVKFQVNTTGEVQTQEFYPTRVSPNAW